MAGTIAALATTTPSMVETLSSSTQQALRDDGFAWARIQFEARNAVLSGTATYDEQRIAALARLASIAEVAEIADRVILAPLADPYSIEITVNDGNLALAGSVPNETLLEKLQALPIVTTANLEIRSGQPDDDLWQDAVNYTIGQAALVQTGKLSLSGLDLEMSGIAKSSRALGELEMALSNRPAGLTIASASFTPMHVSPYVWTAEFDGSRIAVSGNVPEEKLVERYRLADISGTPLATGVSLASGAPEGFADLSRTLLEQLSLLESGEASIVDGVSRLSGAPPSVEVAQAVTDALSNSGSIVQLAPPRIADYWLSVTRQESGILVFDGYVPDEQTRNAFGQLADADVSFLKLGAGAPSLFRPAADFGLELLPHLAEGRFTLRDNKLFVSGVAASASDYLALRVAMATVVPQGIEVDASELVAPRAANYRFAATRQSSGNIVLTGMLPNPDMEQRLLQAAGSRASAAIAYASGEPLNFADAAEKAMKFIPLLASGEVVFEDGNWTIRGAAAGPVNRAAIDTEFALEGLAQAGWTLDISETVSGPLPADPYIWSAERLADGSFLFEGNVPAEALRKYLAVRAGARVSDTSIISAGAPDSFVLVARAAVDALLQLEQGRIAFDGTNWTITGEAADTRTRDASIAILDQAVGAGTAAEVTARAVAQVGPYLWSATKSADSGVVLSGAAPTEAVQRFLVLRSGNAVSDTTIIDPAAPDDFIDDALRATEILPLLAEGTVRFDGSAWRVDGQGTSPEAAGIAATLLGDRAGMWTLNIAPPPVQDSLADAATTAPEPPQDGVDAEIPIPVAGDSILNAEAEAPAELVEPAAETPPAPVTPDIAADEPKADMAAAPSAPTQPATAQTQPAALCRETVDALSAQNAILFQSGAALIAAGAAPTLDAFAQALHTCPDAIVHVEGHTDSDGDDRRNLALSVARAEAVVEELLARGIAADRLYAIGYGEARPVADNGTANGKRQNRRIVISVLDEHE